MNFFLKIKKKILEIIVILIIAFIPTSFLLKDGIFLNGDATFPVDKNSEIISKNAFYSWVEDNFGIDILETNIREPLRYLIYLIFQPNYDFSQFFYYFFIFFLGGLGIYFLFGFFIK